MTFENKFDLESPNFHTQDGLGQDLGKYVGYDLGSFVNVAPCV